MNKKNNWILPLVLLISSLAWILAWPPGILPFLSFILLIPVIYLADSTHENTVIAEPWKSKIPLFIFLYFLIMETISLGWISRLSLSGAFFTIILGTVLKTLPIYYLRWVWKKSSNPRERNIGALGFMGIWIMLEWLSEHVFSFSWTHLGLGLSGLYRFIQWYEYTGSLGGTLWILALNLLGYELLKYSFAQINPSRLKIRFCFLIWLGVLLAPSLISIMRYESYEDFRNRHYNQNYHHDVPIVWVQPNFNPRTQKFDSSLWKSQLNQLIHFSKDSGKPNTEYFIWPETSLEPWHGLDEDHLLQNPSIYQIRKFLTHYKNASLVLGATTFKTLGKSNSDTLWFNSAIQLGNDENVQVYHKQILVPGVEKSPFQWGSSSSLFSNSKNKDPRKWISNSTTSPFMFLGGIPHYFVQDGNPKIVYAQSGLGLGVLICFESAFEDYARQPCLQGAGILAIISNDAWWGNCPEPYQHRDYARILAIENRRSLVQSSNGGLSYMISQTGCIEKELGLSKQGSQSGNLDLNEEITLYTQYGDWILYPSIGIFIFSMIYLGNPRIRNLKNKPKDY